MYIKEYIEYSIVPEDEVVDREDAEADRDVPGSGPGFPALPVLSFYILTV